MKIDPREFKLKINLKPSGYHGNTVRKNLSQTLWKKIRMQVLEEYNYTCSICGFSPLVEELKSLHVHEVESYSKDELLCSLHDLNLICQKCHAFHHIGRAFTASTKEQIRDLELHFAKVNNCSVEDFREYFKSFKAENRKTMEEFRARAKDKETDPIKEKSILDNTVLYRIEGNIPLKKEAIQQLADKGLYRFFEDEE